MWEEDMKKKREAKHHDQRGAQWRKVMSEKKKKEKKERGEWVREWELTKQKRAREDDQFLKRQQTLAEEVIKLERKLEEWKSMVKEMEGTIEALTGQVEEVEGRMETPPPPPLTDSVTDHASPPSPTWEEEDSGNLSL